MLTHLATDLLPGGFPPHATHSVVISGIDTATGQVWYNNAWGLTDQETTVNHLC
jgi:hypothetical protein